MKRTLLSLLSILILSTTVKAQETYLVANGTTTNSYVPVYGYYCDAQIRCQTIYPSSMVEEMTGGVITGIKWFLATPASESITGTFQIRLGETSQSSFSNTTWINTSFTTVYTGNLNLTSSTCSVTFTEEYAYEGGNLVVEIAEIEDDNFASCSFYGTTQSGGSLYGYSYSSWQSASGTTQNFIPKTEFTAEVGATTCPKPTATDPVVDDMTATINWTENGTASSYAIYLNNNLVEVVNNVTTYTFSNLSPITNYTIKIRAICGAGDTSFAASKSFTTPCATYSLPFNEGFEGYTTGSGNMAPCWESHQGSNFVQASYASSGSNSLHMGGPGVVITPPLATNGRPLEVIFSAKCESTSISGAIQVGFTTDPTNLNDVQWGTSFQPSDTYHHEYVVEFENTGTSSTGYVVFKQTNTTSSIYYYWIDDIYIGVLSDCRKPENLTVHTLNRTGAGIGWESVDGSTADSYYFEWRAEGETRWNGETVRGQYTFMTDLTMGTTYEIRVRSVCGSDTSRDEHLTFTTPACYLEMAEGSTSSTTVPMHSGWNYSYTQMLYPASVLNNIDTIYGISFYVSATNTRTYTIDCYIGNTTANTVSTSSYVASSQLTRKVQNRQIVFSQGWNYISFSSPFIYDGSSNIVVAVDNNTGGYSSGLTFKHHTTSGASSCYWYQDSPGDIYPSQPSATYNGNSATVPDIRFVTPCPSDQCMAPLVAPGEIESHSVTLHWQPQGSATSWKVEYKLSTESAYLLANANVTGQEYTLNDLNAGVTYNFRVTANCTGTDNSAEISVFTKCDLFDVPYTEDFTTGKINPCWTASQTSANYPTVVAGVLYTGPDDNSWVILPEFTEEVTSLMVTLTAEHSSATGTVTIGVTNGHNINSFEEVESFEYTTDITEIESYLDVYQGNGTNIALKFNDGNTNIDNIVVSLAPSCRKPNHIRVVEVDATTATLTWDAGENATGAIVKYHRVGARWNTVEVAGNTVTLTDLVANNPHEVIVKAICEGGDNSENSKTFTFRTGCADGSTMATEGYPYIEDFENGIYCWQQEYVAQELEWVTQKGDGESNAGAHGIESAYLGKYNAVLFNFLDYTVGPKTRLISPLLNTESLAEPMLRFAYGLTKYTEHPSEQQYSDEVSVYYRTSATGSWVQLKNLTEFTTGWVLDSVNLPVTSSTFQISFLGYFKGGNGVALDDVRVYTSGHDTRVDDNPPVAGIEDMEDAERVNIAVYPNPASGSTTVQIDGAEGNVTVSVMDMSGRTLRSERLSCNSGCTHQVNLSGLAQGAYFVRVMGDQVNTVRKLIVR